MSTFISVQYDAFKEIVKVPLTAEFILENYEISRQICVNFCVPGADIAFKVFLTVSNVVKLMDCALMWQWLLKKKTYLKHLF